METPQSVEASMYGITYKCCTVRRPSGSCQKRELSLEISGLQMHLAWGLKYTRTYFGLIGAPGVWVDTSHGQNS